MAPKRTASSPGRAGKKTRWSNISPVLILSNFSTENASDEMIYSLFRAIGPVVNVVVTPGTGTQAVARITMQNYQHAYAALVSFDGLGIWGTNISVTTPRFEEDLEAKEGDITYSVAGRPKDHDDQDKPDGGSTSSAAPQAAAA